MYTTSCYPPSTLYHDELVWDIKLNQEATISSSRSYFFIHSFTQKIYVDRALQTAIAMIKKTKHEYNLCYINLSIVTIHTRFFERTVPILNIRPLIST